MTMGNFQMIVLRLSATKRTDQRCFIAIERLRLSLRQLITGIVGGNLSK